MIHTIPYVIQQELAEINTYIQNSLFATEPILQQLIQYLLQHNGKQYRSQLVLLSAGLLHKNITAKTRRGAALIDLLHHASIIHDDVVDEASVRRNKETVNAMWGNKIAVLFGDYLFANILKLAVEKKDYEYLSIITATAQQMSEGEIIHLKQTPGILLSEINYLEIIRKKTGSLFGSACAIGAISVGASIKEIQNLCTIGDQLGIAFQLIDDILDYSDKTNLGKASFMDFKNKKLTLPLIYSLEQASISDKEYILSLMQKENFNATMQEELLAFVNEFRGISYTIEKIDFYKKEIFRELTKYSYASDYVEAFSNFVKTIINC